MSEIYLGNIMGPPGPSVIVDTEVSDTSENAIQNKAIKKYVDEQQAKDIKCVDGATIQDKLDDLELTIGNINNVLARFVDIPESTEGDE